jgi:hypothetical protein
MARRRYTVTRKAKPRRTARQKASWSLLALFELGGKRQRVRAGGHRGAQHAIRDQADLSWWGMKRGR